MYSKAATNDSTAQRKLFQEMYQFYKLLPILSSHGLFESLRYYRFFFFSRSILDVHIHLTVVRVKHLVLGNKQRHGEVFKNSFHVIHADIWSRMKGSHKNSNITSLIESFS